MPPPSFYGCCYPRLKDGELLCDLVNALKSGTVSKIHRNVVRFEQRILLFFFLFYCGLPCLVLCYLALCYLVLSWLVLSCLVLSSVVFCCLVLSFRALSCLVSSCVVLSFLVLSCLDCYFLLLSSLPSCNQYVHQRKDAR